MSLFKIITIAVIVFNVLIIPVYLLTRVYGFSVGDTLWKFLYLTSYAGALSLIVMVAFLAVRIRSSFKGTQLRIGKRHLHEGTIGIVFIIVGVNWNIWHWFDPLFAYGTYYMFGWVLSMGGLVWIVIGAVFIGRDWDDVKNGRFFNKEEY